MITQQRDLAAVLAGDAQHIEFDPSLDSAETQTRKK